MIKNPSWTLPEVFVLITPRVILMHFSEWVVTCRPRRGMRIFVLIVSQVNRIQFGECQWEVVVCRPRRHDGILKRNMLDEVYLTMEVSVFFFFLRLVCPKLVERPLQLECDEGTRWFLGECRAVLDTAPLLRHIFVTGIHSLTV